MKSSVCVRVWHRNEIPIAILSSVLCSTAPQWLSSAWRVAHVVQIVIDLQSVEGNWFR